VLEQKKLRDSNRRFYVAPLDEGHPLSGRFPLFIKRITKPIPQADSSCIDQEIYIYSIVKHEHIGTIFFALQNSSYITLIYPQYKLDFHTLVDNMTATKRDMIFLFKQLVSAVGYLHSLKIIHADIKLENIVMKNLHQLCLIDFDLSIQNVGDDLYYDERGTRECYAPEMVFKKGWDYSIDYWCLGFVFYEMLHNTAPFMYNKDSKKKRTYNLNKRDDDDIIATLYQDLLQVDRVKRLGYQEPGTFNMNLVLSHKVFEQCIGMDSTTADFQKNNVAILERMSTIKRLPVSMDFQYDEDIYGNRFNPNF
jgi:serine/threonine protein kinase